MTFDPILEASAVIQWHIALALVALVVGPFALFRDRRDGWHKALGRLWVAAIAGVSLTGLMIESPIAVIGHFGPIHLFSVFALWGVTEGLWHIRHGRVARHRASMQSVWFGAMGLAGLFTLLPGRILNRALLGEPSWLGLVIIAIGVPALLIGWRRWLARICD